ncbi:MAG: cobalamin biosynthesis protein CbiD [Halanaerobiales bacterium]|nr:cobalamin biosynthesis protein CbiD [Halanaerobiales bacterium]
MEEYVLHQGKRLKIGFTTGTCAAIAAKGALWMLINNKKTDKETITLPQEEIVTLPIVDAVYKLKEASAGVIKDGGDDPDITTGLIIYAKVRWSDQPGVHIKGGIGVGQVTRRGLQVPVGEPAINPIPRKMIVNAIKSLLPKEKGIEVEISVPGGEEVAKKTFNPELGIEGGISILGTTGIVKPMSEEAYRISLALKVKQLAKSGAKFGVLVPGNYGEKVALEQYNIDSRYLIQTSNFIGYLLEVCADEGLKRVLLIGHVGKLIKVSGGIFHTHSRVADARQEIFAGLVARFGGSQKLVEDIFQASTTETIVELIDQANLSHIYSPIAERIAKRCEKYVYGKLEVGVVLYTFDKGVLAESEKAKSWKNEGWDI